MCLWNPVDRPNCVFCCWTFQKAAVVVMSTISQSLYSNVFVVGFLIVVFFPTRKFQSIYLCNTVYRTMRVVCCWTFQKAAVMVVSINSQNLYLSVVVTGFLIFVSFPTRKFLRTWLCNPMYRTVCVFCWCCISKGFYEGSFSNFAIHLFNF